MVEGRSPGEVTAIAARFGANNKMPVAQAVPGYVKLAQGEEWVNGRRHIDIYAQPAPGGTMVTLQGWISGPPWGEVNVDPRGTVFARFQRKRIWKRLMALAQELGAANAGPLFRHE